MSQNPLEQPRDPKFEQNNLDFRTDEQVDKDIIEKTKRGESLTPREASRRAEKITQSNIEDREDLGRQWRG